MAAYSPSPSLAAHAAAKAYVLSLGEALHVELAPKVGVTILFPGLMETGFNAASGFVTPEELRRTILPTSRVAQIGLDALFAGRPSVAAGRLNSVMVRMGGLLPRQTAAKLSYGLGAAARRANG
jgi:short-subunit dehydrogenase